MPQRPGINFQTGPPRRRVGPGPKHATLFPHCRALKTDGWECRETPKEPHHSLCLRHHQEKTRLVAQYKQAQADFGAQIGSMSSASRDVLEELEQIGSSVVSLRTTVHERFYSWGMESRGHIQQILMVKKQVSDIEGRIAAIQPQITNSAEEDETVSADAVSGTKGQTLVYRSLLSPDTPMSELAHLHRDAPVIVLRNFVDAIRDSQINQIYAMFPSLNDSKALVHGQEQETEREPDSGDMVIRYVFREFLIWTGDTDSLARASKTETIDEFLRHSTEELELYVNFLQNFHSGRDDTSHFLRDAICDFLLPNDAPYITILGGRVASDHSFRKMSVAGWDLLYQYFYHENFWMLLEQYSCGFEDLLLAKKLSALQRYSNPEEEGLSWLHPQGDLPRECFTALMLGFVAQTKGFWEPKIRFTNAADGKVTEKQWREYLTGRMSKNDPLAKKLIAELASRVVRFMLVVYDRQTDECVVNSMDGTWITRTRTENTRDELSEATWKVEWSLEDILSDLQLIRTLRDRMMDQDYYEFIIIERNMRPSFDLPDVVGDALMRLSGTFNGQEPIIKFIRKTIPAAEQDEYLEALVDGSLSDNNFSTSAHVPRLEYEGHRLRAWDVLETHPSIYGSEKHQERWDTRELCVLSGILASMEASGVIVKADKFERPLAAPRLVRAVDGHEDLYFDYTPLNGGQTSFSPRLETSGPHEALHRLFYNDTLRLGGEGLRRFAEDFKAANPAALFAKGMIHTHYCAWPFPDLGKIRVLASLNFQTPHGHLYKWKHLPFDFPTSFHTWQYLLHCEINSMFSFVRATQTTFVICGSTPAEAESNAAQLLAVASKKDWKLSIPMVHHWTNDLNLLDAQVLWRGIQPLVTQQR